jgi:hypothetical protein
MRPGNDDPRVTSPVPRAVWESLLRSDRGAAVSQSLPWRDAVFASGRYQDVSLLYEFASGRQVVLPMTRPRWRPQRASVVASWPHEWSVGGPISQEGRVSPAEAAAVLADVARRGTLAAAITLRYNADGNWLSQASQFRVEKYGCYVLDLRGGFGHVWQHKFRGDARTAVRKAERSGLDIEVDRSGGLLGVFSDLYEKSIRDRAAKLGQPLWLTRLRMNRAAPAAVPQVRLVADHFGKDCVTWVARSGGQPVAALIALRFGTHAHGWRVAVDKELAQPVRASEYLHRLDIEEACREGYSFYNMGGAPEGSPLARYKEKLGAALRFTHELRTETLPACAFRVTRQFSEDLARKALRLQG